VIDGAAECDAEKSMSGPNSQIEQPLTIVLRRVQRIHPVDGFGRGGLERLSEKVSS
jgi:hypothetical protein